MLHADWSLWADASEPVVASDSGSTKYLSNTGLFGDWPTQRSCAYSVCL